MRRTRSAGWTRTSRRCSARTARRRFTGWSASRWPSTTRKFPPSVHSCEQLPTSDLIPPPSDDSDEDLTPTERLTRATSALRAGLGRSRERQWKIVELILAGEVAHADRFANCMRHSVQLECPQMAGGCGSEDNFVPVTCDSRLCPACMDRRMGRAIQKYRLPVSSFDHPALLTLTIENTPDPEAGKEAV